MRSLFAVLLLSTTILAAPAMAQSKKELAAVDAQLAQRLSTLESRMLTGDPAGSLTTPRTYGGGSSVIPSNPTPVMDTETFSSQAVTPGGSTLSQIPTAPVFKEQTLNIPAPNNDVSQLSAIGQTKLAEGDFSGAQTAFKQYLQFNPDADDAGEVNFWLGESYYVRGGYADAADAYITSMRKDPKGAKAPDAMVRLAATLGKLGNKAEACQTLATFPAQFPNAAANVKEKLNCVLRRKLYAFFHVTHCALKSKTHSPSAR